MKINFSVDILTFSFLTVPRDDAKNITSRNIHHEIRFAFTATAMGIEGDEKIGSRFRLGSFFSSGKAAYTLAASIKRLDIRYACISRETISYSF